MTYSKTLKEATDGIIKIFEKIEERQEMEELMKPNYGPTDVQPNETGAMSVGKIWTEIN